MKKRIVSLLLAVSMIFSMLPMGALPSQADSPHGPIEVRFHAEIVSPTWTKVDVGDQLKCGSSYY